MSAVENFIPNKSPQVSGFCAVVQSFNKAASEVSTLVQSIFEAVKPTLVRRVSFILKETFTRSEKEEIKLLKTKAKQEDSRAQYELEPIYQDGTHGVKQDIQEAIKWFQLAVLAGALGFCALVQGFGKAASEVATLVSALVQSIFEAIRPTLEKVSLTFKKIFSRKEQMKLLKLRAEQGDPQAQYELGRIYRDGTHGVEKDIQEAMKWFQPAAEKGNPRAQNTLGCILLIHKDVKQDNQEGVKWIRLAAEQGDPQAERNLRYLHRYEKT